MVLYRWHHKWRIGSQWEVSCLGQRHTAASVKSLTNLGETCLQLLTEESEHMTRTCQIADISSGHACRGDPEIGDGSGRQHLHDVSVDTSNTRGCSPSGMQLGSVEADIVPHCAPQQRWHRVDYSACCMHRLRCLHLFFFLVCRIGGPLVLSQSAESLLRHHGFLVRVFSGSRRGNFC